MDLPSIIQIANLLGLLLALVVSGTALIKSWKRYPKEKEEQDVDLSIKYQDLLNKAMERAKEDAIEAESKIKELEATVEEYKKELQELRQTVGNHEEEIKTLKNKISEQEGKIAEQIAELNVLRKKVLAQDVEVLDLKKKLGENGNT